MLQPIIDLLQYQVFCRLVRSEVEKLTNSLCSAGIPAILRFDAVGEVGKDLLKFLEEELSTQLSGEAILRINDRSVVDLRYPTRHIINSLVQLHPAIDISVPFFLDSPSGSSEPDDLFDPSTLPASVRRSRAMPLAQDM
jgi:hypothetical protein